MKVLLINGSPKEKGNTFQALSEVSYKAALLVDGVAGWVNAHIMTTCITKYGGR